MILDEIVADKKTQLIRDKAAKDLNVVRSEAEEMLRQGPVADNSFSHNLRQEGLSIIGEFKNASPSLGNIKSRISLEERIEDYNASVECISCLTEEAHFKGNVGYFEKIRKITKLPMIRKDFMIDEYQFYEARAIQADAVLLIATILDDVQLHDFYQLAGELKLDALVEVHDEQEMERALKLDADIIGVNNRNLKDFTISLERTRELGRMVPKDKIFVAESGIVTDEDVAYLESCRVDGFLIGRALMEHDDPKALSLHWKEIFEKGRG